MLIKLTLLFALALSLPIQPTMADDYLLRMFQIAKHQWGGGAIVSAVVFADLGTCTTYSGSYQGTGGAILAAFVPSTREIQFNKKCKWADSEKLNGGTLQSMLHEYGHALGVGHSLSPQSVMYPVIGGMRITPMDQWQARWQ